jgi:hypothetical protein
LFVRVIPEILTGSVFFKRCRSEVTLPIRFWISQVAIAILLEVTGSSGAE